MTTALQFSLAEKSLMSVDREKYLKGRIHSSIVVDTGFLLQIDGNTVQEFLHNSNLFNCTPNLLSRIYMQRHNRSSFPGYATD